MSRLPVPVADLLVSAVRDQPAGSGQLAESLSEGQWHVLLEQAHRHRVVGYVLLSLRESSAVPKWVTANLEATRQSSVAIHLRAVADLAAVSATLDDAAIPWLTFKGPVLAGAFHLRPDLRHYLDLDVLVAPRDLEASLEALECGGFVTLDRNWDLMLQRRFGEVHLRGPAGTWVDLHWHVLNSAERRAGLVLLPSQLLERRRFVPVGSMMVPTFDAVDTLLHLGLHTAASGGDRLGWLKDVERVISVDRTPWLELRDRAIESRAARSLGVVLERVRSTLGVPFDGNPLSDLVDDRGWRLIERLAQRVDPVRSTSGHNSLSLHVARSSRPRSVASWTALLTAARGTVRGRSEAPVDENRSATDDRAGFLSMVASQEG